GTACELKDTALWLSLWQQHARHLRATDACADTHPIARHSSVKQSPYRRWSESGPLVHPKLLSAARGRIYCDRNSHQQRRAETPCALHPNEQEYLAGRQLS